MYRNVYKNISIGLFEMMPLLDLNLMDIKL